MQVRSFFTTKSYNPQLIKLLPSLSPRQEWGQEGAHFAFGSNSRIRFSKAKSLLAWMPKHSSVIDWLNQTDL